MNIDILTMSPRKVCILIASIFGCASWTEDFEVLKNGKCLQNVNNAIYVAFSHISGFLKIPDPLISSIRQNLLHQLFSIASFLKTCKFA